MPIRLTNDVIRMPARMTLSLDPRIQWLRGLLPPHLYYVETRGPAVMLGKHRTKMETVNDVSGHIFNFYSTMRNPNFALQLVELVSGKLTRPSAQQQTDQIPVAVQRAFQFFELCRSWMRWPASPRADGGVPDRLAIFAPIFQRFHDVQVERVPVLKILQRYDSPFTCHVVDATAGSPRQQVLASENGGLPAMLKMVRQVKGRVLLCGNANPLFDDALVGWRKIEQPTPIGISTGQTGGNKFAWMNYPDARDLG